ncbi:MAG: PilN domain-containing protein [Burkholderiales bacterium]|jgi:type IV pilus assembly protein PilN|nr:PilN domain-containing protein [Burkholderiales bacterium]MCA3224541.1 PilN domain-containing protein [Burkholderiales bacterium]MCA3230583.1 PilN domain-containing protein [Burkholderiales bacterium]
MPHREARRERQKKMFWFLTGLSAVAGGVLVFLVWSVLQGLIGGQQERNELVAAENRKLDAQIKEIANLRNEIDALRARQRAVEDLQADRNQPVYLLDELARQTPEGIYLRTIKQEGLKVNVTGFAASNERVSEYLRNLQNNSRFLDRPELIEIRVAGGNQAQQQSANRRLFEFVLNFYMKPTPVRAQVVVNRTNAPASAPAGGSSSAAAAKK